MSDLEIIENDRRSAFVLARDFRDGEVVPPHSHSLAQLLHTLSGVLLAQTPGCAWAVPPGRALWIPPGICHSFSMSGFVRVRALYVCAEEAGAMPAEPTVVLVTPLIRELIVRALELPEADESNYLLVVSLLLAELRGAARQPLSLPLPRSAALQEFAQQVRARLSDRRTLPEIAKTLGVSAKTMTRRFVKETGLTPDAWRRHARLLAAVAKLEAGEKVTDVALDLGFESVSSFTEAFRETFGATPSQVRGSFNG